ncbi:MAG: hypothetical protein N3D80_08540 [Ignavibacterium album]|nr:hypothetical protein [Ignavibacterium album]
MLKRSRTVADGVTVRQINTKRRKRDDKGKTDNQSNNDNANTFSTDNILTESYAIWGNR